MLRHYLVVKPYEIKLKKKGYVSPVTIGLIELILQQEAFLPCPLIAAELSSARTDTGMSIHVLYSSISQPTEP